MLYVSSGWLLTEQIGKPIFLYPEKEFFSGLGRQIDGIVKMNKRVIFLLNWYKWVFSLGGTSTQIQLGEYKARTNVRRSNETKPNKHSVNMVIQPIHSIDATN